MRDETRAPREDEQTLAGWGTENLTRVIAIDSQSDEKSESIPSSEGQRRLSDHLCAFFGELGYETEQDENANLLVTIPSNAPEGRDVPAVAFMVHMDTSEGTQAVEALQSTAAWDGGRIRYPENDRLHVTVENYPETACFMGEDLLHGPGRFPVGLDDKLGMCELMTLAQVLRSNPEIQHGPILMVFRPDEEIGRMGAVEGLAGELAGRGIRYGYTIDGLLPFEINVENFNASRGRVTIAGTPLSLPAEGVARRVALDVVGVNTHGATAKPEGYLNSTVIYARALQALGSRDDIWPVDFRSNPALECNAELGFLLRGGDEEALDRAEADLLAAFQAEIAPHEWKGALVRVARRARAEASGEGEDDGALRLAAHLQAFLSTPGVAPLLSEDSEGFQGYTNPHFVEAGEAGFVLDYRLRDFDPEGLARREEHLRTVCEEAGPVLLPLRVDAQYINMGPKLKAYPELVDWAERALAHVGAEPRKSPIRGGTGVDPFLARDVPVANLGTGYFAPESEKEFTSRQNIARHTLWLTHLVQVIAGAA